MMCAIRIVQKPSWPPKPAATNSASSEEPITISGEAIGRKMIRFAADRPAKRCRTRANATSVPRMVATSVASRPIWMLRTDRVAHARVRAGVQPVVEREPVELVDQLAAVGSLKLISTTTKIGTNM